jgi:oligosaccharyltransferase complex subunit epsilon
MEATTMPQKGGSKSAAAKAAQAAQNASSSAASTTQRAAGAIPSLWKAYNDNTSDRLKFIDAFLVFIMLSGVVQFVYCVLVTDFPFNAFLAG